VTTNISAELRGLFHYVTEARLPTAGDLHGYFQARGLPVRPAGPNLECPPWSTIVAPEDSFVEIGGKIAGIRFGDDPRGIGAYAQVFVTNGTLQEVEAVTGPLSKTIPRGSRYETLFVRVVIRGQRIAVDVAHDNGDVKSVNVQF
jgi:hypothetical protein